MNVGDEVTVKLSDAPAFTATVIYVDPEGEYVQVETKSGKRLLAATWLCS